MVTQTPLDSMHLFDLGVIKKMLVRILQNKTEEKTPKINILKISPGLLNLRKHFPKEFPRKPRSLDEIHHWKATEFHQFLAYTGPIVLFNKLPSRKMSNERAQCSKGKLKYFATTNCPGCREISKKLEVYKDTVEKQQNTIIEILAEHKVLLDRLLSQNVAVENIMSIFPINSDEKLKEFGQNFSYKCGSL
ncbi:uncharacterized protein LOC118745844 isoform X2 [Rhagoletis pomonella]|uniref:uncharacterized protein LOC118745844 isoform X2 n=1 Tax=Rhagoletis pomonella TaxID=28610 RepID=UPI00177C67A3|nr:uncharacterized protein LOC118745844 isoform X2 [Rhagoletis pomonella]